jgi:hypothetical protein
MEEKLQRPIAKGQRKPKPKSSQALVFGIPAFWIFAA